MRGAPASVTLEALPDERVGELCRRVLAADGAQAAAAAFGRCRMVHAGRVLESGATLEAAGVGDGAVLYFVLTAAGGARSRRPMRRPARRRTGEARRRSSACWRPRRATPAPRDAAARDAAAPDDDDDDEPICRICHEGVEAEPRLGRLFSPCLCRGSVACVHVECLNPSGGARAPTRARRGKCQQCG